MFPTLSTMSEQLVDLSTSLNTLLNLGSCIGRNGPFTIILSTPSPVFEDEPCEVVNEKGENKIILGGTDKKITAEEICNKLSKIVLQGDRHASLFYEGIIKVNDTTFEMIWGS